LIIKLILTDIIVAATTAALAQAMQDCEICPRTEKILRAVSTIALLALPNFAIMAIWMFVEP